MNLEPWQFLLVVNILLLIVGCFMETSSALLILAPILLPIAVHLGVDPIHLGIIMVMNLEIGMVTPPLGLNLFVASGMTGLISGFGSGSYDLAVRAAVKLVRQRAATASRPV